MKGRSTRGGSTAPRAMPNITAQPQIGLENATREKVWLRQLIWHRAGDRSIQLACLLILLFLASCAAPDRQHQIVVSVRDQKLALLEQGKLVATYPISTSKFCIGDRRG